MLQSGRSEMKVKRNHELILNSSVQFNLFGLRRGHASLYKYLEKCAKEKKQIESKVIAQIFWTEIRNGEDFWDKNNDAFRRKNDPQSALIGLKNKDVYEFFSTNEQWRHYFNCWCMYPVKCWLKGAIGSLVMRGVLSVIPKLDTQLLEN